MKTLLVFMIEILFYAILWRWVRVQPNDDFGAGLVWAAAVLLGILGDIVWCLVWVFA